MEWAITSDATLVTKGLVFVSSDVGLGEHLEFS